MQEWRKGGSADQQLILAPQHYDEYWHAASQPEADGSAGAPSTYNSYATQGALNVYHGPVTINTVADQAVLARLQSGS